MIPMLSQAGRVGRVTDADPKKARDRGVSVPTELLQDVATDRWASSTEIRKGEVHAPNAGQRIVRPAAARQEPERCGPESRLWAAVGWRGRCPYRKCWTTGGLLVRRDKNERARQCVDWSKLYSTHDFASGYSGVRMKRRICLAGLLTVISSLALAGSDSREPSTPATSVASTTSPAVRANPGLDVKTLIKTRTGISAVLTRMVTAEGTLDSLWSKSRAPQRPAGTAKP